MIPATPSLFQVSRAFRWTVGVWVTAVLILVFFVVYGILLIRPDRIAEKQDVATARAALETRLQADDQKRDIEHEEAMRRIKNMAAQQEKNIREIQRLKAKLSK